MEKQLAEFRLRLACSRRRNTRDVLQPEDGGHDCWCAITDVYEDVAFGYSQDPLGRLRVEDILQDKLGAASRDVGNAEGVVLAELWTCRRLPVTLRR